MNTSTPTAPPSPPLPSESTVRRLCRIPDQGRWAGVAAGLGWSLGVDPALFRIAFVVLAFSTGPVAIGLYVLLWLALPTRSVHASGMAPPPRADGRTRWITALAIIVVLSALGAVDALRGDTMVAAGLIGLGVLLFVGGDRHQAAQPTAALPRTYDGPQPPPPTAGAEPTADEAMTGEGVQQGPACRTRSRPPAWSAYAQPYAAARGTARSAPRVRARRSRLGPATLALAVLGLSAAALASRLGLLALTMQRAVAIGVFAIGVGLVVGTVLGRARWLIVPGLAGCLLIGVLQLGPLAGLPVGPSAGVGDASYAPTSVMEAADGYALFAGDLTIDLTDVPLGEESVTVPISMGMGQLQVTVPADAQVLVSARINAGEYDILGFQGSGTNLSFQPESAASTDQPPEGAPRLLLQIRSGLGDVTVISEEHR